LLTVEMKIKCGGKEGRKKNYAEPMASASWSRQ
jgi:hypothetical protein